jgi:hypothetical protein
MGNCLVTKLNAVVNNDDLIRLNALTVQVNASNTQVAINKLVNDTITPVVIEPGDGVTVTSADPLYPIFNGTGKAYIYDVYDLYIIMVSCFTSYKWEDLKRCKKLRYFDKAIGVLVDGLTSIDELNVFETNLIRIGYRDTVDAPTLFGDFKDLNTPQLSHIDLRQTGVTGNIAELGRFPISKIAALVNAEINKNRFNGSIEDMVAVRRGVRGDTTGTLTWDYPTGTSQACTFNGSPINISSANVSLTWDATTITFNGTTINNDSVINQAQLEALRANGYQH